MPQDTRATQGAQTLSIADTVRYRNKAWTAEELADLLALSTKHIYRLAKLNRMPSIRIGGSLRFDPKRTADWIEGKAA